MDIEGIHKLLIKEEPDIKYIREKRALVTSIKDEVTNMEFDVTISSLNNLLFVHYSLGEVEDKLEVLDLINNMNAKIGPLIKAYVINRSRLFCIDFVLECKSLEDALEGYKISRDAIVGEFFEYIKPVYLSTHKSLNDIDNMS